MSTTKPSVLKVWQERPQLDRQPTCHDCRNPAAPWLALDQDSEEAMEDREFARAWATTRASQTLASQINPDEGIGQRPRKPRQHEAGQGDTANMASPVAISPVIALIEHALTALPRPTAAKRKRAQQKGPHGRDH